MASETNESHSLFARRPREKSSTMGLPLLRTPDKRSIGGIILSHDMIGTYLHYWKGRSRPHKEENCEPCAEGNGKRWKSYVIVQDVVDRKRGILEIPPYATDQVDEFFKQHRTLRGWRISLSRPNKRANGRVCATFHPAKFDEAVLGECPPLIPMLLRMWEMTMEQFVQTPSVKLLKTPADELEGQLEFPAVG